MGIVSSGNTGPAVAAVTLTNAQVLALPTTPIQIVPAPGSGKVIVPLFSSWVCDASAGAYTNFNAFDLANPYKSSVFLAWDALVFFNNASGPIRADQLLGAAGVRYCNIGPISSNLLTVNALGGGNNAVGVGYPATAGDGYVNVPLHIGGLNIALGNFTGGNAANRLTVTVAYYLHTV